VFVDLAHYYIHKGDLVAARNGQSMLAAGPAREFYCKAEPLLDRAIACDREVNRASRESRLERGIAASKIYDVGQPRVYDAAAKLHLRLGDVWRAVDEARYSVHLMPGDANQWRLLSLCERSVGRWHEAAVATLEALVLGDDSAAERDDLVLIYAQLTPGTPAVFMKNGSPSMNAGNAQLRADLQEACRDIVRRFLEQRQEREARKIAEIGVQHFGCTRETFKDLLP
jgi:hypothetical protein